MDTAPTAAEMAPGRVAVFGPDIDGRAPGGMASASRRLLAIAGRLGVQFDYVANFVEGSAGRRLFAALRADLVLLRRQRRWSLVHIQVAGALGIQRDLVTVALARLCGLPVVLQFHGAGLAEDYALGSPFHRLCYRVLVRSADVNLVLGEQTRVWMAETFNRSDTETLHNWCDADREAGPPATHPTLTFLGRVGRRKGVTELITALIALAEEGVRPQVNIAGDGDVDDLRRTVTGAGLAEHVTVHGWVSPVRAVQLLEESLALVLPSRAEGLPMAILEAMAAHRAVIASPVGDIPEAVVDGRTGVLVPAGDAGRLAEVIRSLVAEPDVALRMGAAGHARLQERFSPERAAAILTTAYGRALSDRGQQRRPLASGPALLSGPAAGS